tara:strand:+ start:3858 stop:4766 length:909 start_codon:yes stop_codon:yes gene_type:complete
MKIWYDIEDICLSDFISEKFLFLPLFSDSVIKQDNDFKNNKWVTNINSIVEYSSIEDADCIVYHDKLNDNIIPFLKKLENFKKPIIAFFNDDSDIPVSETLPENLLVYRTSINKKNQKPNEIPMPAWSQDFDASELRKYSLKPVVSFCGAITHPIRYSCIKKLNKCNNLETSFIIRNAFWGGNIHGVRLREEYKTNMQGSDLVLCCRGAGNFSYRLYETLSCGKIPIIVDTDITLPCDNVIDWNNFIITTPENIVSDIKQWWKNMDDKKYAEIQRYSRSVYEDYLNPAGFANYISNSLKSKI